MSSNIKRANNYPKNNTEIAKKAANPPRNRGKSTPKYTTN